MTVKKSPQPFKVGELEKAEEEGLTSTGPSSPATGTEIKTLGLSIATINNSLRDDYDIPNNVNGVVITKVDETSSAAEKDLIEGDVIVEVNQQSVNKPGDVRDIVKKAAKNNRSSVLLLVNRAGEVRFVALKLVKEK